MASDQDKENLYGVQNLSATPPSVTPTQVPSALRSLGVTDSLLSLSTSSDQQSTEAQFGGSRRNLNSTVLEASTTIYVPDRGNVLAGSTDWLTTAPSISRGRGSAEDFSNADDDEDADAEDDEDYGDDSIIDVKPSISSSTSHETEVVTCHKRQKAQANAAPSKRQKVQQEEADEHAQGVTRGNREESLDELLPYRSFMTIAVPPRPNPKSEPVQGDPKTYYGDMNHIDSMMTYWLDQVGHDYQKTAELCTKKIKPYTFEGVRKRHIATLEAHVRKYGVKPLGDIPPPLNEKMKKRGKPRAYRKTAGKKQTNFGTEQTSTIGFSNFEWASGPNKAVADKTLPIYVREAPFRQIEATAIVVCKDLFQMDFFQIRDLMEKVYDFPTNEKNIESYYHAARPSAWGSKYHNYSNINENLSQSLLSEKKEIEAAIKAMMTLSQGGSSRVQQTISQRRPPVKISSQINKDGKLQLLVGPNSPIESKDAEALLNLTEHGVESGDHPADTENHDNIDVPEIPTKETDGQMTNDIAADDKTDRGDNFIKPAPSSDSVSHPSDSG